MKYPCKNYSLHIRASGIDVVQILGASSKKPQLLQPRECAVFFDLSFESPFGGFPRAPLPPRIGLTRYFHRDEENLDKMKEKGDECIFVGYSNQSRAYRVFNKKTRVIMESIHVNFNELPLMASDQLSSDPVPECQTMALNHDNLSPAIQRQANVPQADRTVTTSNDLDLLFSLMFDELLNGSSNVVSKSSVVSAADDPYQRQHCTTPLNNHTTPAPTYHPVEQVIGNPSQSIRTRHQLESDAEMCMFALIVSRTEPKNIKEAMADSAWIESMQEELHQFDRLDMKEVNSMRLIRRQQLEDVPELIQHIQSLLPAIDAARTCVLSKSWLHAWSIIPTLRLRLFANSFNEQQERRYMRLIRRAIRSNPLIDCVNLRVLELLCVHISEEVFHNLLSTCKLLESINLRFTEGLEKIKVNNLHYLQELKIAPTKHNDIFEIYDVPSLCSFHYIASMLLWVRPVLFKMDSIGSLIELYLMDVFFDDAFSDMINSKFPFLECLTLKIKHCKVGIVDIRCATLRRLEIQSWQRNPIKVQVNAPKLLFYLHRSVSMPSLLFPSMAPEQIELSVMFNDPIDHLLFLKMRETLNLSSKFNIAIQSNFVALVPFNIDDVRTRVPFPATNVEKRLFETCYLWDSSLLFDAFFSICQPMYVEARLQVRFKVADYFLKLIKEGARKNKTGKVYWPNLKYCEILRNSREGKWEKLTSDSLSLLDGTLPVVGYFSEFKLTWGSP
nr:hypothetical protein [Tanacetum cinerariifolium]